MLIGILGFYMQFLSLSELWIRPWRYILSKNPQPVIIYQKEYMEMMQKLCTPESQRLLERLKEDIVSVPTLTWLDPYQRFDIDTDWSKD